MYCAQNDGCVFASNSTMPHFVTPRREVVVDEVGKRSRVKLP